ncbi:UNVERIFIED_ORG: hypothetical protein OKW25_004039 [Pseudomonas vranovensis]|nr:hypothetical protein [Pseudomonas vranovensis]
MSFLDDVVLDAEGFQVSRQHVLGEARLLLVHVHRDDVELDRRHFLQVQQNIEHGVAVFAAGQADHDLVTVFDHVEVGDGFASETTQAFLQFVLVDRKGAHSAWNPRGVTKAEHFTLKPTAGVGQSDKDCIVIKQRPDSAICSKKPALCSERLSILRHKATQR